MNEQDANTARTTKPFARHRNLRPFARATARHDSRAFFSVERLHRTLRRGPHISLPDAGTACSLPKQLGPTSPTSCPVGYT
ncbi:hypothetical protein EXIGLDRAFT_722898 [Exidia glandulosa HHB12029]|uniref:Uncharacterized protein n=1 Tax=Exidia glandulosa HHB12029 TaxID=1314781 RepID=A0A165F1Z4_EXIGL|nr:hypothetical protein EXIGLDRAFT_722898 [Exidia glandulosa HHB12029]